MLKVKKMFAEKKKNYFLDRSKINQNLLTRPSIYMCFYDLCGDQGTGIGTLEKNNSATWMLMII